MFVVKQTSNNKQLSKTLKSEGAQALSPKVPIVSEGPSRFVCMRLQEYKDIFTKMVSHLT